MCWRSSGYTPVRISTHAVESYLSGLTEAQFISLVSYAYQDCGHTFWVFYIPGTDCSWVYDVGENLWHKRAFWDTDTATFGPHRSWNHAYAFGQHLVGDWNSGNLYLMSPNNLDDFGNPIRRLRRSPTLSKELDRIFFAELRIMFNTGQGPQPPLTDGSGNPRPPQAILRWSDDHGSTWSNQHVANCGSAGQYGTYVRWQRLGQTRYGRVYELSVTDPIPWAIVDAFLR